MNAYSLSDKQLVQFYANGSEKALEVLLHRHKRRVFSYLKVILGSRERAQDTFQDVFIKVIDEIKTGRYIEEDKFIHWVFRIAHNMAIMEQRKRKNMPTFKGEEDGLNPAEYVLCPNSLKEDEINTETNAELIRALIRKLPTEQREVLIMKNYSNMTFKEIADITNVSINTAIGRMRYAVCSLREMLDNYSLELVA